MPLADELQQAYREWRRLAEAEGKAIRAGDWGLVADCQRALNQLQPVITQLNQRLPEEGQSPASQCAAARHNSRATVLELIALQTQNLAALQQRRERLSAHVQRLLLTGRNLRRIQRSYATAAPAAWNSYS
jgi:hypothetical protein